MIGVVYIWMYKAALPWVMSVIMPYIQDAITIFSYQPAMQEEKRELAVSSQTKEKVEAAKLFIERRYAKLITQEREKKENWELLLQKMSALNLPQEEQERVKSDIIRHETEELRKGRKRSTIRDYELIKIIGRGAFGEVRLCRCRENGQPVAIKKMRKSLMIHKNKAIQAREEQFILTRSDNPWIVQLNEAFQDEKSLYLVMEYLPGGDLMNLLMKKDIFTEEEARFYTAEILLALESVHALSYIHRDLKPDNILVDKSGHIKLSDFGLCKHTEVRPKRLDEYRGPELPKKKLGLDFKRDRRKLAYSAVGTPDYVAPEVQGKVGYTETVDWWSMGVILFEMLVGYPPFVSEEPSETWHKILHWRKYFSIPKEANVNPHAADLIRRLVTDPKERLGVNGVQEIKAHPFFSGVDWKKIRERKAPYLPEVKSSFDTRNFDPFEEQEGWEDDPRKPGKKPRKDALFIGYTFKRADSSQSYLLKALLDLEKCPLPEERDGSSMCEGLLLDKPKFELTEEQKRKIFRKDKEDSSRVGKEPTTVLTGKMGATQKTFKEEFKVPSRLLGATQLIQGAGQGIGQGTKSKSKQQSKQPDFLKDREDIFKKLTGKSNLRVATIVKKS